MFDVYVKIIIALKLLRFNFETVKKVTKTYIKPLNALEFKNVKILNVKILQNKT